RLYWCRLGPFLERRLAGLDPTRKTLTKQADRTKFHCSRELIAAARAGALGLRFDQSDPPSKAIKASTRPWISILIVTHTQRVSHAIRVWNMPFYAVREYGKSANQPFTLRGSAYAHRVEKLNKIDRAKTSFELGGMCGRYRRTSSEDELCRLYNIPIPPQLD